MIHSAHTDIPKHSPIVVDLLLLDVARGQSVAGPEPALALERALAVGRVLAHRRLAPVGRLLLLEISVCVCVCVCWDPRPSHASNSIRVVKGI